MLVWRRLRMTRWTSVLLTGIDGALFAFPSLRIGQFLGSQTRRTFVQTLCALFVAIFGGALRVARQTRINHPLVDGYSLRFTLATQGLLIFLLTASCWWWDASRSFASLTALSEKYSPLRASFLRH